MAIRLSGALWISEKSLKTSDPNVTLDVGLSYHPEHSAPLDAPVSRQVATTGEQPCQASKPI